MMKAVQRPLWATLTACLMAAGCGGSDTDATDTDGAESGEQDSDEQEGPSQAFNATFSGTLTYKT